MPNDEPMDDLVITQTKALAVQVCTTLSIEDATLEVNRKHLCGTTLGWVFHEGRDDNPCQCGDHPDRQHMVFVC